MPFDEFPVLDWLKILLTQFCIFLVPMCGFGIAIHVYSRGASTSHLGEYVDTGSSNSKSEQWNTKEEDRATATDYFNFLGWLLCLEVFKLKNNCPSPIMTITPIVLLLCWPRMIMAITSISATLLCWRRSLATPLTIIPCRELKVDRSQSLF